MCLCRRFNTYTARYRWTMITELGMIFFNIIYYCKIALFTIWIEDLPWNFHTYFALQVLILILIIAVRRSEYSYLHAHEANEDQEELVYRRVLKFDTFRSTCFLIDSILSFVVLKANEFFDYGKRAEKIYNWCFFMYLFYCCFIGCFYILFVVCDVVTEVRKWRKQVTAQLQEVDAE